MVEIIVCVGSSCHLKGSYDVIQRLEELVAEHEAEDLVDLSGSFCRGSCGKGVTGRVGEAVYPDVLPDDVDRFFAECVKPRLGV